MITEAHIQVSPDNEICDHCIGTDKNACIPALTEHYMVVLRDETQFMLCIEHFVAIVVATLQPYN